MATNPIDSYRRQIERELQAGNATEHTHRPALRSLIESVAPGVTATNEPKRIACGAPDFNISRNKVPLGHMETKDVGAIRTADLISQVRIPETKIKSPKSKMAERRPPGPKGHFFTGNLPEFRRDPLGFLTRCARDCGDVVGFRLVNISAYLLNHPDYIESVLVNHPRTLIKGRGPRMSRRFFGEGLLTSEGDFWLRQSRLAQPAFNHERIVSYGEVMVN